MKILVKNGKIVAPDGVFGADILIMGGRIARIAPSISVRSAKKINASGLFILPGAIDSHVHFRDPEFPQKEDFSSGSASALAGGVTAIIDMPNYHNPPTTTLAAYKEKLAIASKKSRCDYLLRFGASNTNFAAAARSGAPSLKLFLSETRSELDCGKLAALRHFASFPKSKPICVHAEDKSRISSRRRRFRSQSDIQDKLSAQLATKFALELASRNHRRVHLCHLTTAKEVSMCRRFPLATHEIAPTHLFLSQADLPELRALSKVNPPLRDRTEQKLLWRAMGNDTIIASDHAPHRISEKIEGAPGFPGVGTMLPLMLDSAYRGRLTLSQVAQMCSYNSSQAFGLGRKGRIAQGFDADLVMVDLRAKWKVSVDNRFYKCGWTPFEGRDLHGKIAAVLLRGELAYDGETVLSKPGKGRLMEWKL